MDLKNKLINKAKELGFSSQLLSNEPLEENEDIRYYLWLQEFRKYLAEKMNSKLYQINSIEQVTNSILELYEEEQNRFAR